MRVAVITNTKKRVSGSMITPLIMSFRCSLFIVYTTNAPPKCRTRLRKEMILAGCFFICLALLLRPDVLLRHVQYTLDDGFFHLVVAAQYG